MKSGLHLPMAEAGKSLSWDDTGAGEEAGSPREPGDGECSLLGPPHVEKRKRFSWFS